MIFGVIRGLLGGGGDTDFSRLLLSGKFWI